MTRKSETIWLNEVDSTNRFALDNFECFDSGTLIAASAQNAGRGTKGRLWVSPPDVNVYASLILKDFPFTPAQAAWIGSVAVLQVLRLHECDLPFSVKWPNDVLCGKKKIAGILCETKDNGIVIGIGLNINMDKNTVREISKEATSLYLETGVLQDDPGQFALEIRDAAIRLCGKARLKGIGFLHEAWTKENYLAGKRITVLLPGGEKITGTAIDFTIDGSMMIIDERTSEIKQIISGDLIAF